MLLTTLSPITTHLVHCLVSLAAPIPFVGNDSAARLPPHTPSGHTACPALNLPARPGELRQTRGKRKRATGNLLPMPTAKFSLQKIQTCNELRLQYLEILLIL